MIISTIGTEVIFWCGPFRVQGNMTKPKTRVPFRALGHRSNIINMVLLPGVRSGQKGSVFPFPLTFYNPAPSRNTGGNRAVAGPFPDPGTVRLWRAPPNYLASCDIQLDSKNTAGATWDKQNASLLWAEELVGRMWPAAWKVARSPDSASACSG